MAKLDDLIQQKQQRDEDWKAKKTAEREELGQLSDDAVMRVTSEPGTYLHYLDTQAINPRYRSFHYDRLQHIEFWCSPIQLCKSRSFRAATGVSWKWHLFCKGTSS